MSMTNDDTIFLLGKAISDIQNLKDELRKLQSESKRDMQGIIISIETIEKLLSKLENRHIKWGGMLLGAMAVFSFISYILTKIPLLKPLKDIF